MTLTDVNFIVTRNIFNEFTSNTCLARKKIPVKYF